MLIVIFHDDIIKAYTFIVINFIYALTFIQNRKYEGSWLMENTKPHFSLERRKRRRRPINPGIFPRCTSPGSISYFFDFVEVGGLIGNGTAATESGEDHLQPMHLSRRHAFCRPNPSRDPFRILLNSPKMRPWSFPLPIINAAVHLWAGLPLQRQHKADLSLEGSDACSTADSCPETLCFKARGSD